MSLNRSNFEFDMNSAGFQTVLEEQKQALLDDYHRYYDNESDYLYITSEGQTEPQRVTFDKTLLEKAIQNPEILKVYHTVTTRNNWNSFDLPHPIEVASKLGLKEMVCYLKNIGHFTPFVQAGLLCHAIRDKNIELVQFYIDCGVSVNIRDVIRYDNIRPSVAIDSKGERLIKHDMNEYPNNHYVDKGRYLLIKDGYYSLPPVGKSRYHALFYAIQAGSIEITQLLFKSGALFTNLSSRELSYLSEAKKSDVKILLKYHESNIEFDLAMQQKAQSSPLQRSLLNGFVGFWQPKIENEVSKNDTSTSISNSNYSPGSP